jgi:hypothetical protein
MSRDGAASSPTSLKCFRIPRNLRLRRSVALETGALTRPLGRWGMALKIDFGNVTESDTEFAWLTQATR